MFAERAAKRERRPKRARAMLEEETPIAGLNYCISTHKYFTLRSLARLSYVFVQQPIRKKEEEAESLLLIKS